MPILNILYMRGGGGGSSHSIHKLREVGPQNRKHVGSQDVRGSVLRVQGNAFASELGGLMEVAMWHCTMLLVGL